jgi:hypothetical protein
MKNWKQELGSSPLDKSVQTTNQNTLVGVITLMLIAIFLPKTIQNKFQKSWPLGNSAIPRVSRCPILVGFSRPNQDPTIEFTPSKPTMTCQSTIQCPQSNAY